MTTIFTFPLKNLHKLNVSQIRQIGKKLDLDIDGKVKKDIQHMITEELNKYEINTVMMNRGHLVMIPVSTSKKVVEFIISGTSYYSFLSCSSKFKFVKTGQEKYEVIYNECLSFLLKFNTDPTGKVPNKQLLVYQQCINITHFLEFLHWYKMFHYLLIPNILPKDILTYTFLMYKNRLPTVDYKLI